jgi:DNA invertase Pin-like site-specific DNA recombinase
LSREDERQDESNSITNQKRILEKYALDNGMKNFIHYTDDGYSGANFDRPAWKRMIQDIEDGKISAVIAKDMSRIGQNYLEAGYYTEIYFFEKNIHFVAINNNVDSDVQGSGDSPLSEHHE